jgi:hypothetical protein
MRKILPAGLMLLAFCLTAAVPTAAAQTTSSGKGGLPFPTGLRAGYTSWENYGQMHFGAHAKLGDLFPNVQLTPAVEMGFGDDLTLVTVNGDLSYRFTELVSFPWELYGGGCLGLNFIKPRDIDSDFQLGLSGLVGLSRTLAGGDEIMIETRLGILDSPGFKLTVGYTFF